MLTMPGRRGYRALSFATVFAIVFAMLGGCSATPVLHEFPPPLAPDARPETAVAYTLREVDAAGRQKGEWALRGAQGDLLGTFRWQRAFREPDGAAAPDRSEDFRRDDLVQDGINRSDYLLRVSATSGSLKRSAGWGTAPPRVVIFAAATGERVGELELRAGYDLRFEGDWQGRQVLWRGEIVPGGEIERDTDAGTVVDTYPDAQRLRWSGGSDAGFTVYTGHVVDGEPPAFQGPLFDVTAERPLTRRELGDAIVMLFAIRAVEEAVAGVQYRDGASD